jgi:hypothetical protein
MAIRSEKSYSKISIMIWINVNLPKKLRILFQFNSNKGNLWTKLANNVNKLEPGEKYQK